MSWKKTEHFKETEFGPMKTGHTVEHTDCERCKALAESNEQLVEALKGYTLSYRAGKHAKKALADHAERMEKIK